MSRFLRLLMPILLLALPALPLAAQESSPVAQAADAVTPDAPDENANAEGQAPAPQEPVADPYGRTTPRSMVQGLIEALAAGDDARVDRFFEDAEHGAQRARQLQALLDKGGSLNTFAALSDKPEGVLDDDLPAEQEYVGHLGDEGKTPIMLTRTQSSEGAMIWQVSRQTGDIVGRLNPETTSPEESGELTVAGASVTDWGVLIGLAAAVFIGFQLISMALVALAERLVRGPKAEAGVAFARAAMPPFSLFLATVVFQLWADSLPVSIIARQFMLKYIGLFAAAALTWLLVRLIDAISRTVITRMEARGQRQVVSVASLLRRAAKILLLFGVLVAILDTFGIDVTTGIAALGIGGIALALGAQKTVENFVGSVSLIADKPVQIGDFCKIGDILGTVEDIGIRSTRIRTLARTVVTIPNGDLSSQNIENYAKRDRFLFNPTVGVEYGIGSAKLLEAVEIVEGVLEEHERIAKPGHRARFVAFGASSLDIEVFAYMEAADYDESLVIQQDLLLMIFARLEKEGIGIAFPTRTLHLVREGGQDAAAGVQAKPDTSLADTHREVSQTVPKGPMPTQVQDSEDDDAED
ncbi:mechanosensitive ion channel family protein [Novosphingobium mangrovi (ex Hu et al. 2023)]|uniref:Mechanosensitive ion channel n=1 Tax=Novosphingobium mangrovi (ex Hu et al. 2023) TaxID=2930094 RepID=A0ABT0A833_9SPHN|nr:mechanosensitive ion channel domain-containing protein [Novosphingobium mangrovi (ex Hu et al. 2023)]MCJ1959361.1 mechanosensitive ion channel [Novosphingobium mangrovi (ex Hu et al. 2023)]